LSSGLEISTIDNALRKAWGENPDDKTLTGEILVKSGIVTREQVDEALRIQKKMRSKKIGDLLIELKQATEEQVYRALAVKFRKPFIDLSKVSPSDKALAMLSRELVLKLQVVPLAVQDDRLIVATSHPELPIIGDILRKQLHYSFQLVVVVPSQLGTAITRKYSN
jgi:type IV pilus assembly protein PilB